MPANTPASQRLACRLAKAFDEFSVWAKARKVEHLVGDEIRLSVYVIKSGPAVLHHEHHNSEAFTGGVQSAKFAGFQQWVCRDANEGMECALARSNIVILVLSA